MTAFFVIPLEIPSKKNNPTNQYITCEKPITGQPPGNKNP